MDVIQSCQPRFLQGEVSIPELVHDSSAESGIHAVESYRQFAVQMSHEITVCHRAVFKIDHDVIVIWEESPRLENKRIGFRQFESCIAQEIQFCGGIKEPLSMQGCCGNDVNAVRREAMWRRVGPTVAHNASYHGTFLSRKFEVLKRCEDSLHSEGTACETRPKCNCLWRSFWSACASSRRFSEEHLIGYELQV